MGKAAFSVSSSDSPLPAAFYSGEISSYSSSMEYEK
jgi:hypothetical protein